MFYGLKFGEKCDKHPVMKTRGLDTRTQIFHQIQPKHQSLATQQPPPQPASQQREAVRTHLDPAKIEQQRPPSASATAAAATPLPPPPGTPPPSLAPPQRARKKLDLKVSADFALPSAKTEAEIFSRIDFNGNGMLSLAELDKAVIELWPKFNNKPAIMRAYKAADANGSGFVSKREFHLFLTFLVMYQNLWIAFEKMDTSGDRRLSLSEFCDAAESMYLTKREAADLFNKLDTNGGGQVLFDEFCAHFANEKVAEERAKLPPTRPVAAKAKAAKVLELPSQEKAAALFSRIDFNGNGMLSLAELDKAVIELWPKFNNKPAIMRAYKATDANGSGFLSKSEFKLFLQFLVVYQNLWEEFMLLDADSDRRISLAEFLDMAPRTQIFKGKSEDELKALFAKLDSNGGGQLLFDEFCDKYANVALKRFIDETPASRGGRAPQRPPLLCHYCGKTTNVENHQKQCREALEHHIAALPSYLARPLADIPAIPDPRSAAEVDRYNKAAAVVLQQNVSFECPECRKKFHPSQIGGHWKTHNIDYTRKMAMMKAKRVAPALPKVEELPEHNTDLEVAALKRQLVGPFDLTKLQFVRRQLCYERNSSSTLTRAAFKVLLQKAARVVISDKSVTAIFQGCDEVPINTLLAALEPHNASLIGAATVAFDRLDPDGDGSIPFKVLKDAIRKLKLAEADSLHFSAVFERPLEKHVSRQEFVKTFVDLSVAFSADQIASLLNFTTAQSNFSATILVTTISGVQKTLELQSDTPMRLDTKSLERRLALHGIKDLQRIEVVRQS